MFRYVCFILLASAISAPCVFAELPVKAHEVRAHYLVKGVFDPSEDYQVTVVNSTGDEAMVSTVLIADGDGNRFVIQSKRDFMAEPQTSSHEVRDAESGEFIRETLVLPFTAKGWKATHEQAAHNPELQDDKNSHFQITFKGNSGGIAGVLSDWKDVQTLKRWRSEIRSSVPFQFLESLEEMDTNGLFRSPELLAFDSNLMPKILYRTECKIRPDPETIPQAPDCGFDKKFGFECSDKQKERAEAGTKRMRDSPTDTGPTSY